MNKYEIKVTKTGSAISIALPFELKDAFRSVFKTAKWSPAEKVWVISSRSEKRLNEWINRIHASSVLDQLSSSDQAEMNAKEIRQLENDIERIKAAAASARANARASIEAAGELSKIREDLDAAKADRDAAVAEQKAAQEQLDAVRRSVNEIVETVVSIAEIEKLRKGMWFDMKRPKAVNKKWFNEKQGQLEEILEKLENAGIGCDALTDAVNVNFNRPDRDAKDLIQPLEFHVIENA